ncbi:T9SS type A sorting domain-containing protein [Catalinimonas sp. 4WD22]|uniref:T9SS type A sorting domain-containing protein n=1 Tax=Catalinimonas locisalis TaxID=3133978 RepID=UPI0031017096
MRWLSILMIIVLLPVSLWAQNITAAEYFIDEDAGFGQNISIPISQNGNELSLEFTAVLADLSSGIHVLGVRAKDENGIWSLTTNRTFLVDRQSLTSIGIVAAEYFIDSDAGFGNNQAIEVSGTSGLDTLEFDADLGSLDPGIHMLYMRAKDVNGKWSLVTKRAFVVADDNAPSNIVALNYYYYDIAEDTIAGEGMYTYNIPDPAPIVDLEFPATVEPLENGKNYIMYVWATDDNNRSSLVSTTDITPYTETIPIDIDTIMVNNLACAGEENGSITIEASGGVGELLYSISTDSAIFTSTNVFEGLSAGTYTAYVRGNVDSYVESQSFTITAPEPLVLEIAEAQDVDCASDADGRIEVSASGGAEEGYTYSLNNSDFQESNTFTGLVAGNYSITVRDANGCTTVLEETIDAQRQAPAAPTIRRSNESDYVDELSLIAEGVSSGVELQWYKDNEPIAGATGNTIPVTEAGSYYVVASNGSCVSQASNEISITGLSEVIAQQIKLYPIPANDRVKLEIPPQLIEGDITIEFVNSNGQVLSSTPFGSNRGFFYSDFDVSTLPQGIYFIMLRGDDVVVRKKFSKQ